MYRKYCPVLKNITLNNSFCNNIINNSNYSQNYTAQIIMS